MPLKAFKGTFAFLQSYTPNPNTYVGSTGTAELNVRGMGVESIVQFSGPAATPGGKTFNAHLHDLPCASDGGGHYQNPNGDGSVNARNENWPTVTCDATGSCTGGAVSP